MSTDRRKRRAGAADVGPLEVRRVQPYEARKRYVCPGCNRDIPAGMGHYVVVPLEAPDLRRHWHRGCWDNRPAHISALG